MKEVLGWSGSEWHAKNACRACCYVVSTVLNPSTESDLINLNPRSRANYTCRMISMDGNNSLKRVLRVDGHEPADKRVLESGRFLSSEFVDRLKDEVKKHPKGPQIASQDTQGLGATDEDSDSEIEEDLRRCKQRGRPDRLNFRSRSARLSHPLSGHRASLSLQTRSRPRSRNPRPPTRLRFSRSYVPAAMTIRRPPPPTAKSACGLD